MKIELTCGGTFSGYKTRWVDLVDLEEDLKAFEPLLQVTTDEYHYLRRELRTYISTLNSYLPVGKKRGMVRHVYRVVDQMLSIINEWVEQLDSSMPPVVEDTEPSHPFTNEPSVGVHSHRLPTYVIMRKRDYDNIKILCEYTTRVAHTLKAFTDRSFDVLKVVGEVELGLGL